MLVEGDALVGMTEKFRQDALALPDRRAPQVLAIEFEQVEREQHGGGIVTVPADQVENGEPLSLQTTASPSIQARAHRQHSQCRDDLREAACEVIALPGEQPHAPVSAPGHDAESVVLDLVNPAATFGRLLGRTRKAGLDDGSGGRRHTLTQHAA